MNLVMLKTKHITENKIKKDLKYLLITKTIIKTEALAFYQE
jgi:hypothetical protein